MVGVGICSWEGHLPFGEVSLWWSSQSQEANHFPSDISDYGWKNPDATGLAWDNDILFNSVKCCPTGSSISLMKGFLLQTDCLCPCSTRNKVGEYRAWVRKVKRKAERSRAIPEVHPPFLRLHSLPWSWECLVLSGYLSLSSDATSRRKDFLNCPIYGSF